MKRTPRVITILLAMAVFALLPLGLGAQEWGIDSSTGAGYAGASDAAGASVSERLSLWISLPFEDRSSGFELKGNGNIKADWLANTLALTGDVDRLRLYFNLRGKTAQDPAWLIEFGRIGLLDPSGLVLNATADGARVGLRLPDLNLELSGGYTGFLLKDSSPLMVSKADLARRADKDNVFGPQRAIAHALVTAPKLLGMKADLGFTLQYDLNQAQGLARKAGDPWDSAKGGLVNTGYGSLKLSGAPVRGLNASVAGVLHAGYNFMDDGAGKATAAEVLAWAASGTIDWSPAELKGSSFSLGVTAASGDSDAGSAVEGNAAGRLMLYTPLTPAGFSTAFSPGFSNIGVVQAGASLKPFEDAPLTLGLKLFAFVKPFEGFTGAPGIGKASPASPLAAETGYVGTAVDGSLSYKILPDLSFRLGGGVFLPGRGDAGVYPDDAVPVKFAVQASLDLAM